MNVYQGYEISMFDIHKFFTLCRPVRTRQAVYYSNCYMLANVTIVAVEKYGRTRQATDDNIIQRAPFACCITKATNTNSEFIIRVAYPQQEVQKPFLSGEKIIEHEMCVLTFSKTFK